MQYFYSIINSYFGDTIGAQWVLISLAAACAFALSIALFLLISGIFDPIRNRMFRETDSPSRASMTGRQLAETVRGVSISMLPEGKEHSTRHRLIMAGFRARGNVQTYYGIRTMSVLGLPLSVAFVTGIVLGFKGPAVVFLTLMATAIGYIAPSFYLDRLVRKRQRVVRDSFPDVLDMLVVCTEAGLGIDAALQRVGRELDVSHPELAEEFLLVNAEIRAGVNRVDAYHNLAYRTGVEEIRGMVSTMTQSMQFGSNVADVLRIYSEDFRDRRLQAAEEQAAKLAVKLIFPLVFCFMPAFFIITLGPAMLGLSAVLRGIVQN